MKRLLIFLFLFFISFRVSAQTIITHQDFTDSIFLRLAVSPNSSIIRIPDSEHFATRFVVNNFRDYNLQWTVYSAFPQDLDQDDTVIFFVMYREIKSPQDYFKIQKKFERKYGKGILETKDQNLGYYWIISPTLTRYCDYMVSQDGKQYCVYSILRTFN